VKYNKIESLQYILSYNNKYVCILEKNLYICQNMKKDKIIINLKQIKQLIDEGAPILASHRISFLIYDIEKDGKK